MECIQPGVTEHFEVHQLDPYAGADEGPLFINRRRRLRLDDSMRNGLKMLDAAGNSVTFVRMKGCCQHCKEYLFSRNQDSTSSDTIKQFEAGGWAAMVAFAISHHLDEGRIDQALLVWKLIPKPVCTALIIVVRVDALHFILVCYSISC